MVKIKILLISIFLGQSLLFGYGIGDKLKTKDIKTLGIKNDRIYVIDFFASWCISCKIELPLISKLNNRLKSIKYKIIGVNSDKNRDIGQQFVKDLKLNFDIIYDSDNQIIKSFNPIGLPAIYYIKNLKVVKIIIGAVSDIDKKIIKDLKELDR